MRHRQKGRAKRLLPSAAPARLPEEELLARLRKDRHYRRSTSLPRALFYRPRRLLTPRVPSRLAPSALRRELGLRLVAIATSLALLIGMVNFAPINFFSLVGNARAADAVEDYDWLISNTGAQADPYHISTPGQLYALAKLVEGLTAPDSTMSVTINGTSYTVGPGQENHFVSSASLMEAVGTPAQTQAPETDVPSTDLEPIESVGPAPSEDGSLDPSPPPAETAPAPSDTPSLPSPSPETAEEPAETPSFRSALPQGEAETAPSETPQESAAPSLEPSPSTDPEPASSVEPMPSPSMEPEPSPSMEPVPPVESTAPSPTPSELPDSTAPAEPSADPEPTESAEPAESAAPTPSPAEGNTRALMSPALTDTGSVQVPVGMASRYFKLMADLDLSNFSGESAGGASYYWTPIGILSSFDTNGVPTGTPFLGSFDGDNKTVRGLYYAPDPGITMAGYGLFGFVGNTGEVKNLNLAMLNNNSAPIQWMLGSRQNGDGTVDYLPLGDQNYATGVVAAATQGTLSGCTVTQADLSYAITSVVSDSATTAVGGIAGIVAGGTVKSCVFLGKLSNSSGTINTTAHRNQRVGGIVGWLRITANNATPLANCAAGVDIDIHNGSNTGSAGGVGGLVGYCSGSSATYNTNITGCFTTGTVYAKLNAGGLVGRTDSKLLLKDSFSTVTLGSTSKSGPTADFTLNLQESIGGLIGNSNQNATTLTNVYFAGGLLAPQFGAVAGRLNVSASNASSLGLTNVAVDNTQAPHSLAKYSNQVINNTLLTPDWSVFTTKAGAAWVTTDAQYLPQLSWAANSASPTVKVLSQTAAKRWVTPSSANSVAGNDGKYSLYRLKESAGGSAPTALGSLTLDAARACSNTDGTVLGGVYTASATVAGTAIPIARWAVTSANQTEGKANVADSSAVLLRLLDRVNLAGGGYLGGSFALADSAITVASAIPAYSGTGLTPFCGTLAGGTNSSIDGLSYAANSAGLFNTVFSASFQNFTLKGISVDNIPLGNSGYFGFLAGQMTSSSLINVDVDGLAYQYQEGTNNNYYYNNLVYIGLVGTIPSASGSASFTDCDLTGLSIKITGRTAANGRVRVYVGGLLGNNAASSALTIQSCTMSGSILADFSSGSNVATEGYLPHVGGLVGSDSAGGTTTVTDCRVSARLLGGYVGGLLGRGHTVTFTRCIFSGTAETSSLLTSTTATTAFAGGLVGYDVSAGTVKAEQCAVFGNITSKYYAGGLFGYLSGASPTVSSSYASAIVGAMATGGAAGGLVGYAPSVTGSSSYFTGQVSAPGTYGALVGQTTGAAATFANTLYDSILTQRGISTVGSAAAAPVESPACAVKPDDAAWTVQAASDPDAWTYTAGTRGYPRLVWLNAAMPELSNVSTYQLFDDPSALTSLYSIEGGGSLSVTLPSGITAVPGPSPNSFHQTSSSGGTTVYTVTGEDAPEGPLNFTYPGITVAGVPLTLPYTIGVRLFRYGDGTAAKPFVICDLDELRVFRVFVNSSKNAGGVYYQISAAPADPNNAAAYPACAPVTIDMGGINWQGTTAALAGQLDGHGSTLANLTTNGWTNSQGTWSAGLLGGLADGSSVKDLTITGASITSPSNLSGTGHCAGILSATAKGTTVTNVQAQGTVQADRDAVVGGLIGSSDGALTVKNSLADTAVTALGNDGGDAIGAGGLIGSMIISNKVTVTAVIEECAAYGSIVDWGCLGGLVGFVNGTNLNLNLTNSYSLVSFSDTGTSNSVFAGGFLGRVDGISATTKTVVDSCYYAGENKVSPGGTRTVGGYVGGANASGTPLNGRSYVNLNFRLSLYSIDSGIDVRANLYYGGQYNGRYAWPETYYDGEGDSAGNDYGSIFHSESTSFYMSQGTTTRQGVMASWDTSIWGFDDGLFPRLAKTPVSDSLTLTHLAIHYTRAGGDNGRYANVFVRYTGAKLSVDSPLLRVTGNERMAVATDVGAQSVPVTIAIGSAKRTIYIIPSTQSRGIRDASIYYANPDGMWAQNVWEVYTADALAGLSTIFSGDSTDLNSLPKLANGYTSLNGGEVRLARDIDLGANYNAMSDYSTWRPIGDSAHPFNITLNGNGHTLYNLTLNPFYQKYDYYSSPRYTYADLTNNTGLGLFGYVGGGTLKNLTLAAKSSTAGQSVYLQPGVRVGLGVTAAGALAAVMADGRLENCLVSVPVYTLGDTPPFVADGSDEGWSAVPYLGAAASASLGGLVGRVTGTAVIENCAYTGYVYADPKTPRPNSGSPAPTDNPATGPVGGLVGSVRAGAGLTITRSYAAGYVGGSTAGALVGSAAGALTLNGARYDGNAAGGSEVSAVGFGLFTGGEVPSTVSADMGGGWSNSTPEGLYPLQTALAGTADTLSARMRISLSAHAASATAGTLLYPDGSLVYSSPQPGVAATPGMAAVADKSFTKNTDGLTQLELQQNGSARRLLINLRCWYDDVKLVDGVRHYTISTAEELWELGQIVSGGITDSGLSKVAHTHSPAHGYDDFTGAVIHLAADIDLTKLTDLSGGVTAPRRWSPIGTEAHPFAGIFEGGGHMVSGMLADPAAGTQGLFGTVSGTVQDLLVSGASLKLPTGGTGGVLAARLTGTGSLLFCGVSGSVSAEGGGVTAGGLAGSSAGTIAGSFSMAELSTAGAVSSGALGGIVGSLSGGGVTQSYFTGFINAPYALAVGGIAAEQTGGTVSHCYVSAYLDGAAVYRISKTPGDDCRYDGRHLSKGTGGTRQDGVTLAMAGMGWTPGNGEYYPFPARLGPDGGLPDLSTTPLGAAAKLAAAIFTFSGGTGGANYARFQTVTAPSLAAGGYSLRSGNPALLVVSGAAARPVDDSSGEVALRLCLGTAEPALSQRPCWLAIPSALAVAYRFNWDDLISLTGEKPNPKYNTSVTSGGSAYLIRTSADWASFVALANDGGTAGKTFVLDHDIDFGNASIPTVTAPFYGSFQGRGHTLSNFSTSAPLFSSVEQGGRVEFLGLNGGTLSVESNESPLVTALVAGKNWGRIANVAADACSVSVRRNTAVDVSTIIGGLVGENGGALDSCYFYTYSASQTVSQVTSFYPVGAKPAGQRMGGLVGVNTGSITGCYAAFTPLCWIGNIFNGNTLYYSALAGLNDGGTIRYSYWRFAYDYSDSISLTAYRGSDGSSVPGSALFAGGTNLARAALWLSADSYGGSYYAEEGRLKLYSFRLARYDLSEIFGSDAEQYLMLALQFGTGDNAMSSNAICSWKDYLLPNFANLPKTSFLTVRVPVLGGKLTYELTQAYILRKDMADLSVMDSATVSGSARGGYSVTGLGDNSTRVLLDLRLARPAPGSVPWGVYRSDSTLPESGP